MRIKIINFQIQQTFQMVEGVNIFARVWRSLFGPELEVEFHFDVRIKVNEDYIDTARKLEKHDRIQLPNGVKLEVWSVDRDGLIKAKTYKYVKEDLRAYHPIEMFLVYPRIHGHISDRHTPRL